MPNAHTTTIIKTDMQYQLALAEVEHLMHGDPLPDTTEADRLELLTLLIQHYEAQHYPMEALDPIAAIRFRMEQQGLVQRDLVPYLGSRSKVSEVLSGKRQLSKSMIRALHEGLGIPMQALMADTGQERSQRLHRELKAWQDKSLRLERTAARYAAQKAQAEQEATHLRSALQQIQRDIEYHQNNAAHIHQIANAALRETPDA